MGAAHRQVPGRRRGAGWARTLQDGEEPAQAPGVLGHTGCCSAPVCREPWHPGSCPFLLRTPLCRPRGRGPARLPGEETSAPGGWDAGHSLGSRPRHPSAPGTWWNAGGGTAPGVRACLARVPCGTALWTCSGPPSAPARPGHRQSPRGNAVPATRPGDPLQNPRQEPEQERPRLAPRAGRPGQAGSGPNRRLGPAPPASAQTRGHRRGGCAPCPGWRPLRG